MKKKKVTKAEDHFQALQWVGGQFNPKAFDENRVNRDGLWNCR